MEQITAFIQSQDSSFRRFHQLLTTDEDLWIYSVVIESSAAVICSNNTFVHVRIPVVVYCSCSAGVGTCEGDGLRWYVHGAENGGFLVTNDCCKFLPTFWAGCSSLELHPQEG